LTVYRGAPSLPSAKFARIFSISGQTTLALTADIHRGRRRAAINALQPKGSRRNLCLFWAFNPICATVKTIKNIAGMGRCIEEDAHLPKVGLIPPFA
jgi:hypothetical protein